jgi:hypothetical protein
MPALGGRAWRPQLHKSAEKPFMSGYFHAREASNVSKGTGIVYIAGKEQRLKRHTIRQNHARHAYSDTTQA